MLERRSVYFPVNVGQPSLARQVLSIAADLAVGDLLSAERKTSAFLNVHTHSDVQTAVADGEERVAPLLRAQVLARLLIDLANNSWSVAVEDGQIYLRAPTWGSGARGMTEGDLQREKERARQSLAARVQEQLNRPATGRFIVDQERLHYAPAGSRSIAALIADGPALADSLRRSGPSCIRPYLQAADGESGRDVHTGLKLSDIFRYFRYYWSFPYESTPGRTLPILIRDAGQPNHPVCGLLCLTSPIPKLSARDSALGWTPAWLEALVAGLDFERDQMRDHLSHLDTAMRHGPSGLTLLAPRVLMDIGRLLGVKGGHDPAELARRLGRLDPRVLSRRVSRLRRRLVADLATEVETAIRAISPVGLGVTHAGALKDPGGARERLRAIVDSARLGWHSSRKLTSSHNQRPRRATNTDLESEGRLQELSREPLFLKKRAVQLVNLLMAWEDLQLITKKVTAESLRQMVFGSTARWGSQGTPRLTGGDKVSRGLRAALLQRQSRVVASQVADVSVCGALPPYGPLLGGKLAALLALSKELAEAYFARYDGQASEIGSQMAGKPLRRPADLIALTTTSFYAVGSAQYNRVRLPQELGGVSWELVGQSKGHGTIHCSRETSDLLQALLKVETGKSLFTSTFGEGPSERLRKIRDGLARLGLPADSILMHGMPRLVYVAELGDARARPGNSDSDLSWRLRGPAAEQVIEHWRERWLGPRLARSPELLDELRAFDRDTSVLSRRLRVSPPRQLQLIGSGE